MKRWNPHTTGACLIAAAVLATGVCAAKGADNTAPPPQPPLWAADKKLLPKLSLPVTIEDYQLQPPAGYTSVKRPAPDGTTQFAWVGPPREDMTRHFVMLGMLKPPVGFAPVTAEVFLAKMLAGIARQRTNWQPSPIERGMVAGLPFVRASWQGADRASGLPMHGIGYATWDGKRYIYLSSQDVDPYRETTLPIASASILTIRAARPVPPADKPAIPPAAP